MVLNNNRTIIVQNITYGNVGNSTYNSCAGLLFLCALLAVASFVHQYFYLVLAVVVMSSVAFAVNMKCGKHEIYFPASRKNVCSVEYVTRINLDTLFFERVHS